MARKSRVRLIDIAEQLNLSKVSVSKALRDHPDISDDTKRLIKETAAKMGYVPNRTAQSLSSRQTRMIGVVVPKVAHVFFAEVIDGMIEYARELGYEIVLTVSQENARLEADRITTLLSMRVDGLLVSVSEDTAEKERYERVVDMAVPLVFFDRAVDGQGFGSVTVDDEGGAYEGVSRLIRDGARNIAHLAGYGHTNIGLSRRAGYERALRDHGIEVRPEWIVEGGFDDANGYRGFMELHRRGIRPEAVFCSTFPTMLGLARAMRQVDGDAAAKVKLLTFDTGAMQDLLYFPYYCVRQDAAEIGRRALGLLIERIKNPTAPVAKVILPTQVLAPGDGTAASGVPNMQITKPIIRTD